MDQSTKAGGDRRLLADPSLLTVVFTPLLFQFIFSLLCLIVCPLVKHRGIPINAARTLRDEPLPQVQEETKKAEIHRELKKC